MGLFNKQFANVVEWNETRGDVLFWKWKNNEIKRDSKLIIKPGQDAIFLYNGRVEGVFTDSGDYVISSDIIPFLSSLKGFKFGFNSGLRAEVLFINTKEFTVKWGTKSPLNIQCKEMPGGMPIRAFGTYSVKIDDYLNLIENIAGVKDVYSIDELRERMSTLVDQLLMKWIVKEGKDMFNIQANSFEICNGIKEELDMMLLKLGLTVTCFTIENVNYPEQVQKIINKNASYSMVGDVNNYQKMATIESMENPNGGSMAKTAVEIQFGMEVMRQMVEQNPGRPITREQASQPNVSQQSGQSPKFCPECGTATNGAKFCGECGYKLC